MPNVNMTTLLTNMIKRAQHKQFHPDIILHFSDVMHEVADCSDTSCPLCHVQRVLVYVS